MCFCVGCNLNGSRRLLAGTTVSVEVVRVRRDLLKLNTYYVEFELSTVYFMLLLGPALCLSFNL